MDLLGVILAGGDGRRLAAARRGLPKPLVPYCGRPLIERPRDLLRGLGVTRLAATTGRWRNQLAHVLPAATLISTTPGGTVIASLLAALDTAVALDARTAVLVDGDTVFDVPNALAAFHATGFPPASAEVTITVTRAANRPDGWHLRTGHDGQVIAIEPGGHAEPARFAVSLPVSAVQVQLADLRERLRLDAYQHEGDPVPGYEPYYFGFGLFFQLCLDAGVAVRRVEVSTPIINVNTPHDLALQLSEETNWCV